MADKTKHLKTGEWGEDVAASHLKSRKYKVLERRFKVPPHDELDIIARDGKVLVFVEVKTRESTIFGRPAENVDRKKRRNISRAAVRYMKKLRNPAQFFRFDIIEVVGSVGDKSPEINHIENAFTLDKKYILPC